MTLVDIITRALSGLGRLSDAQSMSAWKQKMLIYANDCIADLAEYLDLKRTDTVTAADGEFKLSDLQRGCRKIVKVEKDGKMLSVTESDDSKTIGVSEDGEIKVTYRYFPKEMEDDIDVPDIPEGLHRLIVTYVIYCEHRSLDPSMQGRATAFKNDYERGKMNARKKYGEGDTYNIYNWEW